MVQRCRRCVTRAPCRGEPVVPGSYRRGPPVRPERGIALRKRLPIPGQRLHVPVSVEGQHDVQKAAPHMWPAGHQLHIRGREHDGPHPAQGSRDSVHFAPVDRHLLPPPLPVEAHGHGRGPVPVHEPLQVKRVLRKGAQFAVARTPEGTEALQVVDRFEEVRLPLRIVADYRDPFRRKAQLLDPQVAEVAQLQLPQDHEARSPCTNPREHRDGQGAGLARRFEDMYRI